MTITSDLLFYQDPIRSFVDIRIVCPFNFRYCCLRQMKYSVRGRADCSTVEYHDYSTRTYWYAHPFTFIGEYQLIPFKPSFATEEYSIFRLISLLLIKYFNLFRLLVAVQHNVVFQIVVIAAVL